MEITSSASPTATGGYGGTSTENSPQNYIYQEPIPTATGPGGPGSGTRRAVCLLSLSKPCYWIEKSKGKSYYLSRLPHEHFEKFIF